MIGICNIIQSEKYIIKKLNLLVSLLVVVFNIILVKISERLIRYIKFGTQSSEQAALLRVAFLAQFFNSGILIVLVNMNYDEHLHEEMQGYIQGKYYDYQPNWYREVGT